MSMLLRRRLSLVTMYIRNTYIIYPRKSKNVNAHCAIDCRKRARKRYLTTRENKYKFRGASITRTSEQRRPYCRSSHFSPFLVAPALSSLQPFTRFTKLIIIIACIDT